MKTKHNQVFLKAYHASFMGRLLRTAEIASKTYLNCLYEFGRIKYFDDQESNHNTRKIIYNYELPFCKQIRKKIHMQMETRIAGYSENS